MPESWRRMKASSKARGFLIQQAKAMLVPRAVKRVSYVFNSFKPRCPALQPNRAARTNRPMVASSISSPTVNVVRFIPSNSHGKILHRLETPKQ